MRPAAIFVACCAAVILLTWLMSETHVPMSTDAPGLVTAAAPREAAESASPELPRASTPVTEDAPTQASKAASAVDPHQRWRDLVARAPKNKRFPNLPVGDKPFLHYTLYTCPIPPTVWEVDIQSMLQRGWPVNPKHKRLSREDVETLVASLREQTKSLTDLERVYWDELQEAYHELVERGEWIEVPYAAPNPSIEVRQQALAPVLARLEAQIGKEWQDYFKTQLGLFDPPRDTILYVTRRSHPHVFALYDEIQRVRQEAIANAREFVAAR